MSFSLCWLSACRIVTMGEWTSRWTVASWCGTPCWWLREARRAAATVDSDVKGGRDQSTWPTAIRNVSCQCIKALAGSRGMKKKKEKRRELMEAGRKGKECGEGDVIGWTVNSLFITALLFIIHSYTLND